jgi:predicted esterase
VPLVAAPAPPNAYAGKKILSIHGAEDELVPYRHGRAKIAEVQAAAPAGEVDVYVQDGRGHVCTPEMLRRASEWFWRWGLSV